VAALEAARAEENFAQLCVLYVALTRAKRALYLFVPEPPKKSSAVREADLLRERLAGETAAEDSIAGLPLLYSAGDRDWARAASAAKAAGPGPQGGGKPLPVPFAADPVRREPSKETAEGRALPAKWLFREEAGEVRAFGTALHRIFEKIEWIEECDMEALLRAWRAESMESEAVRRDVEKQFRNCIASPEVRAALSRPAGVARCEAWRETPFDYVRSVDGQEELITGRFDRVVIERDASGRAVRATVLDFKSNRVTDEADLRKTAAGYAAQMRDYSEAAARLFGLAPSAIRATLVFTRLARVFEMDGDHS
jgi:ATP-dependent helicase/nuclease subunit A